MPEPSNALGAAPEDPLSQIKSSMEDEPGWTYGSVLPIRRPSAGDPNDASKYELAWPESARSLIRGLVDLLQGPKTGELTPEASMALLGLAGGLPKPEGALGVFGGRLAAKANLGALKMATDMETAGYHPQQIWSDTGWFKGEDKSWKFEIPDPEKMLNPQGYFSNIDNKGTSGLADAVVHPELFDNYPELKGLRFGIQNNASLGRASGANIPGYGIALHDDLFTGARFTPDEVLAHELQHSIQDIEGSAAGTNPQDIVHSLADAGFSQQGWTGTQAYEAAAGEIEARNVQQRQKAPWLKGSFPRQTEEAIPNQIFLHQGKIYAPIEHDPFVGLGEARAGLGRVPDRFAPVDYDPFNGIPQP